MNKNHVKGTVNQAKGKVKEEVGHAIGDKRMAAKGIVDRIKGKIQVEIGDAKDGLMKRVDAFLDDKRPHSR